VTDGQGLLRCGGGAPSTVLPNSVLAGARTAWGAVLLARPARVVAKEAGASLDGRWVLAARALGIRQVVQGFIMLASRRRDSWNRWPRAYGVASAPAGGPGCQRGPIVGEPNPSPVVAAGALADALHAASAIGLALWAWRSGNSRLVRLGLVEGSVATAAALGAIAPWAARSVARTVAVGRR